MNMVDFYLAILLFLLPVRIFSLHTSNRSNLALLFIPVKHGNCTLGNKLKCKLYLIS